MQECRVCGLLFLDGNACPGCGSLVSTNLDAVGEGAQTVRQRGGIPGLDRMSEEFTDIIVDDQFEDHSVAAASTLPFGVGGGVTAASSSLPFGVGSRTGEILDSSGTSASEEFLESVSDGTPDSSLSDSQTETTTEPGPEPAVVAEPEPEPEPEPAVVAEPEPEAEPVEEPVVEPVEETVAEPAEPAEVVPAAVEAMPVKVAAEVVEPEPVKVAAVVVEPEPVKVAAVAVAKAEPEVPDHERGMIYHEDEEVVHHDFSHETGSSVVEVNLDDLAEPVSATEHFSPGSTQDSSDHKLYPAQALPVEDAGDGEVATLVRQGFTAMASEDWDEAATCFQKVAMKKPSDGPALNNYGLAILQRALALQEDDPYGLLSGSETQFEAAIMALRQAAKTDPGQDVILLNLGNALTSSGRHDKALRVYDVHIDRTDQSTEALNGRAAALVGMGRFDEAMRSLRDALAISAEDPVLISNLKRLTLA